jgi:hypothetical protein
MSEVPLFFLRKKEARIMKTCERKEREMRKAIIFLISLIITIPTLSSILFAQFKPDSEPNGFREIEWGTNISKIKGLEPVGTSSFGGGMKSFKKKDDVMQIGEAKLESIRYDFLIDRFLGVEIRAKGDKNFAALRESCFAKFGPGKATPEQPDEFMYSWNGKKTTMKLIYNTTSLTSSKNHPIKVAVFAVFSTEMVEKGRAKDREKRGVTKGF